MGISAKQQGSLILKGDLYLTGLHRIRSSTYLFKLTGDAAVTAAGSNPGATRRKKLKILIDDTVYYLLAANDWVTSGSESTSPSSSRSPSTSRSPSSSAS